MTDQRQFEDLADWEADFEFFEEDDTTGPTFGGQGYSMPEMTADLVASGRFDTQGIQWDELPITRDEFRRRRVQGYTNYRNHPESSLETIDNELLKPSQTGSFFSYRHTSFQQRCTIVHFQLRHLISATSKNDIYFISGSSVKRWCPQTKKSNEVLNCHRAGQIGMKVSTMTAVENILLVGGFDGEYVFTRLDTQYEPRIGRITRNANGITNYFELIENHAGVKQCIISSNDERIRIMEMNRLQIVNEFEMPSAVNCTACSPNQRMLLVVGDQKESFIIDTQSGQRLHELTGHLDYSFSCSWSACGNFVATGNQDTTARIYDVRNLSQTLSVIPANIGAIRSLKFSNDGAFLFMAEPADFVHIVDMKSLPASYDEKRFYEDHRGPQTQVIDFFGEIAGIAVTPVVNDFLYIANADETYGCLMEYQRLRPSMVPLDDFEG